MKKDKETKCSAYCDKRKWLDKQAESAEEEATCNDMETLYYISRRVTGTTSSRPDPIKAKNRTLLLDGEKKLARWAEHFCEVLN